jgi:hypothetical protein
MTETDPETLAPGTVAGGVLDPYRHICALVDRRTEMHRIFDPCVAEGLPRGERLSLVVGPEEWADRRSWTGNLLRSPLPAHEVAERLR